MPLLGPPLELLLGVLVVAVPVLTVFWWNRFRGPGALQVVCRLAMVGLCQVVALLLVGAVVNNYGYFYGSWSELLGQSSTHGMVKHAAGASAQGAKGQAGAGGAASSPLTVLADPGWATAAQRQTRGQLQSVTVQGARSQLSSHALIYLPPQYFQVKYGHHRFPAAEVFTGFPGNDLGLVNGLRYPDRLLGEMKHHRARPMLLVMMRPSVTFPRDTECTDVPAGPQALTFFSADVPDVIAQKYRVLPRGWGAIGDSTGGYCAVKLAMTNSYAFPAAVALSGYFHTLKDHTTGDLWGGSSVVRNLNDLEWRLKNQPAPPVAVLVTSSRDEGGANGYADTQNFLKLVKPPMMVDKLILGHGGHNYTTWKIQLPPSLSWLSQHLPAAHP